MSDVVLIERDGDIATVVLNRPERMNALNKAVWTRLGEAMGALSAEDDLRCVVLRGAGDEAFAPGADITEFEAERADFDQARSYGLIIRDTMDAIQTCRHPTIALIKGVCVGGGLEIASVCDLRICGESSRFGVPISRIGVIMAYPELSALLSLVGRAAALEILLEGRVFGAEEAHAKGLVNRVVPDERVEEEAYACARRIAEGAPLVNRWHKRLANRLLDPRPLGPDEFDEGYASAASEDYREGYRAFVEKRKPRFKGR